MADAVAKLEVADSGSKGFANDQLAAAKVAKDLMRDEIDDIRIRSDSIYFACQRIDAACESKSPKELIEEAKLYENYIRSGQ